VKAGPVKKLILGVAVTISKNPDFEGGPNCWQVEVDADNALMEPGILVSGYFFRWQALADATNLIAERLAVRPNGEK
jgi:hypothetical protein